VSLGRRVMPGGRPMANFWKGAFPARTRSSTRGGHIACGGRFRRNGFTHSRHDRQRVGVDDGLVIAAAACRRPPPRPAACRAIRAAGPMGESLDPASGDPIPRKVLKGGPICVQELFAIAFARRRDPRAIEPRPPHVGFGCIFARRGETRIPSRSLPDPSSCPWPGVARLGELPGLPMWSAIGGARR